MSRRMLTNSFGQLLQIGLRLTGIWPSPYANVFRFVWATIMCPTLIFQYWYIKSHFNQESLADLIECVSTSFPYMLLFLKLVLFWNKRGLIKTILMKLAADWTDTSITKDNIVIMVEKATLSNRCSQLLISMYAFAVFMYSIMYIDVFRNTEHNNVLTQSAELILKMEFPAAAYETLNYQYTMIAQCFQLLFVATSIAVTVALMITLILHVGGQVELFHQALAVIHKNKKQRRLPKSTITYLLKKHQRNIDLIGDINNLFSFIAFMEILCNSIIICGIGFSMVIIFDKDPNVWMIMKIFFFYLCITSEMFIFCFSGEYLTSQSTSINVAAYNSLWYLLDPADSRVMILLMLRSQRPSTITAGKLIDLSLQRFTAIMKTSASYISILYAMY